MNFLAVFNLTHGLENITNDSGIEAGVNSSTPKDSLKKGIF